MKQKMLFMHTYSYAAWWPPTCKTSVDVPKVERTRIEKMQRQAEEIVRMSPINTRRFTTISSMNTSSNGNIFRVTGPLICALNKRLSKQSRGWWFETPSRSLWRHCSDVVLLEVTFVCFSLLSPRRHKKTRASQAITEETHMMRRLSHDGDLGIYENISMG